RKEHIRGIRGRAVHAAVEAWESSERLAEPITATAEAWWDILDEAKVERPDEILKPVVALWESESAIAAEEEAAYQDLADHYKNVRASKAYKERTAHLEGDREAAATVRTEIEALVDGVNWPWDSDRGVLVEGFDHSLETTRKGMEYLTELWPE